MDMQFEVQTCKGLWSYRVLSVTQHIDRDQCPVNYGAESFMIDNLTIYPSMKKFPDFYLIWMFITVFPWARHWPIVWADECSPYAYNPLP